MLPSDRPATICPLTRIPGATHANRGEWWRRGAFPWPNAELARANCGLCDGSAVAALMEMPVPERPKDPKRKATAVHRPLEIFAE